jgi:hypothetical protein
MLSKQQIDALAQKYGMDPATIEQLVGEISGGGAAPPVVEPGAGLGSPPVPPGQAVPGGDSLASIFGMTPEEWRDKYDPKGAKTLGGKVADWMGLTNPEDRASERPDGLLAAFLKPSGPEAEKAALAEKAVKHVNPFAPETVEAQLEKRNKAKKQGLLAMFGGGAPAVAPTTLGGKLFGGIFG